jgi:hypothetical protein
MNFFQKGTEMTKSTTIKKHLAEAIKAYDYQLARHNNALKAAKEVYRGEALRDQLQKESESHAAALASISARLQHASDEVKALNQKAQRKLSAPVSTETLNALQVLRMRKAVSAAEITAFKNRYGDNPGVMAVLQEIAGESNIDIRSAFEEKVAGSDGLTASGILSALDDLQTHIGQMQEGITGDKGFLSLAVTHDLAGQRIDALGGCLDTIASYAE